MTVDFQWTNRSVALLGAGDDPVATIESRTRNLVLRAIDDGWTGPPFDPLALAQWLKIPVQARDDIPDARTVPIPDGSLLLEYNPLRPRGRLRFSLAHEIAHSLFPDCAEAVRNRGGEPSSSSDDWQLEVLCNIGAAEILMPLGSFTELENSALTIECVMEMRKRFDVSIEACLIRMIKLSHVQAAAFCASAHPGNQYRVDYVIPANGWNCPVRVGTGIGGASVVNDVSAIGFTAKGVEDWGTGVPLHVECVGLAPYPGSVIPRVVGLLLPVSPLPFKRPEIMEVVGDVLQPRGEGTKIVAHVVPDSSTAWGGGGFASHLRRKHPAVWAKFRADVLAAKHGLSLGSVFVGRISEQIQVAHMVAQRGIGPSAEPRLRYASLAACLHEVRLLAEASKASVHMPRVGTGHGGAKWEIVRELIAEELVDKGIVTTVYRLPS